MNLFWSTKRGKIAIFIILAGIVGIPSEPPTGIGCILIGLLLFIPEFIYLAIPAASLWSRWDQTLDSNAQKTRIKRAKSGDLTPRNVNSKYKYATFVGSEGGKYLTTLKKCTCPDFQKRGVPCKHMFYLANELDLLNSDKNHLDEI